MSIVWQVAYDYFLSGGDVEAFKRVRYTRDLTRIGESTKAAETFHNTRVCSA